MFRYIDGNNNEYSLSSDRRLSYRPMTIENSSSGEYSGGEPKDATLSVDDFALLVDILNTIIDGDHPDIPRTMGTGVLSRLDPWKRVMLPWKGDDAYRVAKHMNELLNRDG